MNVYEHANLLDKYGRNPRFPHKFTNSCLFVRAVPYLVPSLASQLEEDLVGWSDVVRCSSYSQESRLDTFLIVGVYHPNS